MEVNETRNGLGYWYSSKYQKIAWIDLKMVKPNCLTLGELWNEPISKKKKKVEYPFKSVYNQLKARIQIYLHPINKWQTEFPELHFIYLDVHSPAILGLLVISTASYIKYQITWQQLNASEWETKVT